jgi:hypothetical protein
MRPFALTRADDPVKTIASITGAIQHFGTALAS